jgi:hypothetical protein
MRMGGQVSGPRVEDTHQADLPTEVVGVQSEGLSGSSRGVKQQGRHEALV